MKAEEPIPFNKPFVAGKELFYIAQAVTLGNLGGDGYYTKACSKFLEERFGIHKVLLTPSCTAALEMAAMLCRLQPGDEVLMPSYTFVSTASAFVREGARPVFVDIRADTLNIDENLIEAAITPRTKAICVVHYAGVGCEMNKIMEIAKRRNLIVIEDAAQGVNGSYSGRPLGSIGDMGCYSFHETKNFICGEGGALCINNPHFVERAEIIRDKGTDRQKFFRGQVDKYTWVDVGSSFVPSELCSAFLYGQLEEMERISSQRRVVFEFYEDNLREFVSSGTLSLPVIPTTCQSNYHLFYVIARSEAKRWNILKSLKRDGINAVFHYVPLHSSPIGKELGCNSSLPITEDLSLRLLRLPLYFTLSRADQTRVVNCLRHALNNLDASE